MLKGSITTDRVRAALKNNGYDVDFLKATFKGNGDAKNGINEMHAFFFINEDTGLLEVGVVYVWEENGKLLADW